ncbi:MAG: hypothetical protein ACREQM_19040 [Candidatus Dormibacteraceae bacterium]
MPSSTTATTSRHVEATARRIVAIGTTAATVVATSPPHAQLAVEALDVAICSG